MPEECLLSYEGVCGQRDRLRRFVVSQEETFSGLPRPSTLFWGSVHDLDEDAPCVFASRGVP